MSGSDFLFQVHHIFPVEVFGNENVEAFLNELGFEQEVIGNKIGLFTEDAIARKVVNRSGSNLHRLSQLHNIEHDPVQVEILRGIDFRHAHFQ